MPCACYQCSQVHSIAGWSPRLGFPKVPQWLRGRPGGVKHHVEAQQGRLQGTWSVAYLGDHASQWPLEFSIQVPSKHDILRKDVSFNSDGQYVIGLLSLKGPVG